EGGAYVFAYHANILMAGPGATAADVRNLAARLQAAVAARFGVRLVWEVRPWPAPAAQPPAP
ncbi:MAG: UDP-N-acetylenolpyruvoylglucosamine reductase, partial [Kiritimatiellae bacterium]|nr:UDP-N-acetylenolpyruvoylglucosamine reductase [Kiritimatiellia bacterium]